jgi:glucan phosphoethanolaminetransferase (alkaline phosphatase superfamily)
LKLVTPLTQIYWARLAIAIVAAAISTWVTLALGERGVSTFLNGLTIALIVYLITYYLIIKNVFKDKVEKQSKLMTQGIGIYFFTWLVFWILIYTIILGQPPV